MELSRALGLCIAVLLAGRVGPLPAQTAQNVLFATVEDARRILSAKDPFTERLSPFDRAARMKTDREVSDAEFREFAAKAALPWEIGERNALESAIREIRPALERYLRSLPERVYLIKTTGAEEGNTAYTRGSAIILPARLAAAGGREIRRLLAHEFLHLATRRDARLRSLLYQAIGFQHCAEIDFPKALAPRKITNPDAPLNDHCIRVNVSGQAVWAVPLLFAATPKYDTVRGGEFFNYLTVALLLVERGGSGPARAMQDAQGPRLVGIDEVSGFYEQVGRNTRYVIHPEEILADNFALLVLGERNVPSPEILERIESAFAR